MDNFNYPEGSDTAKAPWNRPDAWGVCPHCDSESNHELFDVDMYGEKQTGCETCIDEWYALIEACVLCHGKEANPHWIYDDLVLCDACHLGWILTGEFGYWNELQASA